MYLFTEIHCFTNGISYSIISSSQTKLLKKLVVDRINRKIKDNISEVQIGGMEGKGSRDHLMSCILSMREFERQRTPLAFLLLDITKCFDKA